MQQAILKNAEACTELSKLVSSSLGPNGMNKMVINHLEKIFVTSDCGTILSEMEVNHPAAKLICMAADMQSKEKGDSTNLVVSFCGELLGTAHDLLRIGVPIPDIVEGFNRSHAVVLADLPSLVCHTCPDLRNVKHLAYAVKSAIAAKQYGYEDLLAPLIAEACSIVMPKQGKPSVNTDSVRVLPMVGGSIESSQVLKGFAIALDAMGSVREAKGAKIAVLGCSLSAAETETKGEFVE